MRHNDQWLRWRAFDRAAIACCEMLGKSTQAFFWKNQRHFVFLTPAFSTDSFDCKRNALPNAHAHRGKSKLAAVFLKSVSRRQCQAGARHSQGMTERDRTAVRVDVFRIIREPQLPQAR